MDEIETTQNKKLRIAKCNKCGKEGWIKSDGYDEGELKNRLALINSKDNKVLCVECIDPIN